MNVFGEDDAQRISSLQSIVTELASVVPTPDASSHASHTSSTDSTCPLDDSQQPDSMPQGQASISSRLFRRPSSDSVGSSLLPPKGTATTKELKLTASKIPSRPSVATHSSRAQVISNRSFISKWDSASEEIFKSSPSVESVIDPTTLYFSEAFAAQFETEVQEAFFALDADNNGSIDEDELRDGIKAMGAKDDYIPEAMLEELRRTGNITISGFREIVRVQRGCKMLEAHFQQHPEQRVPTKLTVIDYTKSSLVVAGPLTEEARLNFLYSPPLGPSSQDASGAGPVTRWINVEGLDSLTVRELAIRYNLDPMAIDDALQVEQRPKMDYYDHGVFVVVPMLRATAKVERNEVQEVVDDQKYAQVRRRSYTGGSVNDVDLSRGDSEGRNSYDGHGAGFEARNLLIEVEAVSIFVVEKERTIITIQEKPGDCWHDLRVYMKHTWSRVRGNDHNFLLYSLLDLTTDSLFPVLKEVLQCIDRLQDQLESAEGPDAGRVLNEFDVSAVQNVKKQLLYMHRMLRPMRSVLDKALVDGSVSDGSASSLNKYFLDVQSHMTQILEDVEEGISECRDLTEAYNTKVAGYQSAQADRQSQVLYMLTFVTILIAPLQILTGLYGMNFAVIPELEWKYGYLYFWSLAIFLMLLLGLIFKYMGWLKAAPYDKN